MFRVILLFVIALGGATARATSIFDDPDPVPRKDAPPLKQPSPTPPPANDPAPTPPPRLPEKQPNPGPTTETKPLAPETPAPPNPAPAPVEAPAENPAIKEARARDAAKAELASAQAALRRAEKAVNDSLEKDATYVKARDHARIAMDQGNFNSPYLEEADNLRASFFSKNAAYQDAKQRVATLTKKVAMESGGKSSSSDNVDPAAQLKQNIADAILRHDLLEGMTFQEACKSARIPFELVSTEGNRKTYHWIIKGQTGTIQVTRHDIRGRAYNATEATYGVIAYVQGIFEDDHLVSFERKKP